MYGMFGLAERLNIQNCKIERDYMYGMAGLAEKLKIQNCINSTGNCGHYMYGLFGFAEKLNIQNWKIRREIVYIICIDCLDLQKN